MDSVRAPVAVVAIEIGGVAVANGAGVGVGASGRVSVRTLATQEED